MDTATLSHGRGTLPADAAASLHRLDAHLGRAVQVTEAGRTVERQLFLWEQYRAGVPGFNRALHPSDPLANHVLLAGRRGAVDSDEQTGVPWAEHGWILTAGDEPWHREYFPDRDQHKDEDDMFTEEDRAMLTAIRDQVGGSHARKTSLRQDLDRVSKRVRRIEAAVNWLKTRIGGSVLNGAKNLTALIRGGK